MPLESLRALHDQIVLNFDGLHGIRDFDGLHGVSYDEDGFEILGKNIAIGKIVVDVFGKDSSGRFCILEVKTGHVKKATSRGKRQIVSYGEEINRVLGWFGVPSLSFRYILYIVWVTKPTTNRNWRPVILSWSDEASLLKDIDASADRWERGKFKRTEYP